MNQFENTSLGACSLRRPNRADIQALLQGYLPMKSNAVACVPDCVQVYD